MGTRPGFDIGNCLTKQDKKKISLVDVITFTFPAWVPWRALLQYIT